MAGSLVLTEDEAFELLAFLVTSARIQQDEPAQYGSLRLLTAAERLSSFMMKRSSAEGRSFLAATLEDIERMTIYMSDVERFVASLDELCREIAQHLVDQNGLAGDTS